MDDIITSKEVKVKINKEAILDTMINVSKIRSTKESMEVIRNNKLGEA
jgi:hypothetical protein